MGARQDGKVEAGEPLRSAITARTWNRAKEAADLVLGSRIGFAVGGSAAGPSQLVVPVRVTTAIDNVGIGHVVQIMGATAFYSAAATRPDITENPQSYEPPRIFGLRGNIPLAQQFSTTVSTFQRPDLQPTGVIVGGSKMPTIATPQVVQVCIAGLCVARVRRSASSAGGFGFVLPAVVRDTTISFEQLQQFSAQLAGVYEPSDFGVHRLLRIDTTSRVSDQAPTVTWGLVVL